MERVYVTKEMEEIILNNVENLIAEKISAKKKRNKMLQKHTNFRAYSVICERIAIYENVLHMIGITEENEDEQLQKNVEDARQET